MAECSSRNRMVLPSTSDLIGVILGAEPLSKGVRSINIAAVFLASTGSVIPADSGEAPRRIQVARARRFVETGTLQASRPNWCRARKPTRARRTPRESHVAVTEGSQTDREDQFAIATRDFRPNHVSLALRIIPCVACRIGDRRGLRISLGANRARAGTQQNAGTRTEDTSVTRVAEIGNHCLRIAPRYSATRLCVSSDRIF